ncbi:hypothetical protein SSX86_018774 [Deinandra increscens subsp. villosa]|uniref:DUF7054 domain-containing protein n=1 Tax=Deinandra increscens subsp. villosa TaxID=3103831 RepID=A0AAP0CWM7_9ASTR
MSTKKSIRKAQIDNKNSKKGKLTEKAMSFHGHSAEQMVVTKLRRPRTLSDLNSGRVSPSPTEAIRPRLTKLLINVTVQRSLGPLQVLVSPESAVRDLIADALRLYSKEGRRPILPSINPSGFGLHYSQFSLESLDRDEKLIELGSRNFFLCPVQTATGNNGGEDGGVGFDFSSLTTSSSCSEEAENVTKTGAGWLRFINFLQGPECLLPPRLESSHFPANLLLGRVRLCFSEIRISAAARSPTHLLYHLQKNSRRMNIEKEEVVVLPKPKVSCTTNFDALWFCYSPVHQMQQYYRLGSLDNCGGKWNALVDCLKLKTKRSHEAEKILETREKEKVHIWSFRTPEEAASNWNDMFGHLDDGK